MSGLASRRRRWRRLGRVFIMRMLTVAAGVALVLQAANTGAQPAAVAPPPTYTEHVAPILQQRCGGCHRPDGIDDKPWGSWPSCARVCWSHDGGRTFEDYSYPEAWKWTDTFEGQTWERSCSARTSMRSANGWIVAAKRMDVRARYIDYYYDSFTGTGVSISRDKGEV